ncbi:hypothetical protein lbkm_2565 [Lachnospiraceae bacterium KM106-2]|nr:hypothetical protein lbkm_2565 [Lachnospiraceae bacterium KM106-2]
MKNRNRIIIALFVIGLLCFGGFQFYYRSLNKQAEKNVTATMSYETHDFSTVTKYNSKYMGDASNIMNLLSSLPLMDVSRKIALDSDNFKLTINYQTTYTTISASEQRGNLLYTGIASFVLIDNLKEISYHFEDVTFNIKRDKVVDYYKDLATLKDPAKFKTVVQTPLKNKTIMSDLFKKFIIAE